MANSDESGNIESDMGNKEPVKILLADDDKDDQGFFSEALDAANIPSELTTVKNGQEVIEHLKDPSEPNPDIIFLDINMPFKGGKEALAEIKSDEELKEIPTVMLSTSDDPQDIEESFQQGANLYVRKPNS
ncbi:MAG: response regulator, partial [Bacteroidia bacterium]